MSHLYIIIYTLTALVLVFVCSTLWAVRRARRIPRPGALKQRSPRYICVGGHLTRPPGGYVPANALPDLYKVPQSACLFIKQTGTAVEAAARLADARVRHPEALVLRPRDAGDYEHHLECRRRGVSGVLPDPPGYRTYLTVGTAPGGSGKAAWTERGGKEGLATERREHWCTDPMCPVCAAQTVIKKNNQ